MDNRIAIAADHAGFVLKKQVVQFLKEKKFELIDLGTNSPESVDYTDYALKVAQAVASGKASQGCLICYSGVGMSIAANKVPGIRAALCMTPKIAELSRQHNNSNILCLAAGFVNAEEAKEIVGAWLEASFEGGRHERRVNKITEYENNGNNELNGRGSS